MTEITERLEELTVNEIIRRCPASVEVFNRHGIDACCGGAAPVPEAAQRDGADVDTVLSELRQVLVGAS